MYMFSAAGRESLGLLKNGGRCRQKKPRQLAGLRYERGSSKRVPAPLKEGRLAAYALQVLELLTLGTLVQLQGQLQAVVA